MFRNRRILTFIISLGFGVGVLLRGAFIFERIQGNVSNADYLTKSDIIDHGLEPVQPIDIKSLVSIIGNKANVVIDARPKLFWDSGHIPGAINLPKKHFSEYYPVVESVLRKSIPEGGHLLVYCLDKNCPDATDLAQLLYSQGFQNISVFEGGWEAWVHAGLPVEMGNRGQATAN